MPKPKSPIKTVIAALIGAFLLSACTVQLAYNNLDRLVLRWVNDQVELTSQQRQWVREALNDNLDWHCQAHLPEYVAFLGRVQEDIQEGNANQETLESYGQTIARFGEEILEVSMPIAVQLLQSLDEDQIIQLQGSFEKSNQETIERLGRPNEEAIVADRGKRMERRLSRFMGRLNNTQKEAIALWAQNYRSTDAQQLAYAYRWQQALLDALALRNTAPDEFAIQIETLFDLGSGWDEAYEQTVEVNRLLSLEMMSEVLAEASGRQQQRLLGKMQGYANDFDALSCQADQSLVMVGN